MDQIKNKTLYKIDIQQFYINETTVYKKLSYSKAIYTSVLDLLFILQNIFIQILMQLYFRYMIGQILDSNYFISDKPSKTVPVKARAIPLTASGEACILCDRIGSNIY